jgi:hypothetical protein
MGPGQRQYRDGRSTAGGRARLNRGDAQRLLAMRQSAPFKTTAEVQAALPPALAADFASTTSALCVVVLRGRRAASLR